MPCTFRRLRAKRCSSSASPSSGDATGVPQRGREQVTHGVFNATEHVAPQELAFSQCLVELGGFCGTDVGRVETRLRVVLGQDRLAPSAESGTEVVNHGGDQGANT